MILDLISAAFTGIGFAIAAAAVGIAGGNLFDKLRSAAKARRERTARLMNLLERIEANTRPPQA